MRGGVPVFKTIYSKRHFTSNDLQAQWMVDRLHGHQMKLFIGRCVAYPLGNVPTVKTTALAVEFQGPFESQHRSA